MAVNTRIILSGLWVTVMLIYLLGDVLRIFAGHADPGKIDGKEMGQSMWLLISIIMLVPILMVILSLILPFPEARWVNIIIAVIIILFNLAGLPYKGWYDNFLIGVSFIFNGITIWYAWKWVV